MRVIMLVEKLPPEFTGSGRQAMNLAAELRRRGVDVVALCSLPRGAGEATGHDEVRVVRLRTSGGGRARALRFSLWSSWWLWRHRGEYDILHVHGYCWAALAAAPLMRLAGKRSIYKITLPGEDDPAAVGRTRLGWFKLLCLGRYDLFIAISERVRAAAEALTAFRGRVRLIPNGVDARFSRDEKATVDARQAILERHRLPQETRMVAYVGSLEQRKGTDLLAAAWPTIAAAVPRAVLFLVGPYDPSTPFFRELAATLGTHFGSSVIITGPVDDPRDYYRAAEVFVFPSRNEAFGNVLLEAMACGTACVASRIEGVTEGIITHGQDGLVVPAENKDALAGAVVSLMLDEDRRRLLAGNAARTVEEHFRMGRIAERYIDLYRTLLEDGA